jgi:predicted CoA-binding protein
MELQKINDFFNCSKFAVVGVSSDTKKMGNAIFRELKKQSFDVVPINPSTDEIEGVPCYHSIAELPATIEALIFTTRPEVTHELVKEAIGKEIKYLFFQQGSAKPATIELAKENGINVVYNRCVFMFANPKGMHKFHMAISKLFRTYPN